MTGNDLQEKERTSVVDPTQEDKEMSTRDILGKLATYLWPRNHPDLKLRVVGSVGLLIGGKILNVQVIRSFFKRKSLMRFRLGTFCFQARHRCFEH